MKTIPFPKKAALFMGLASFFLMARVPVSGAIRSIDMSGAYSQYHNLQLALAGDNAASARQAARGLQQDLKGIPGANKAQDAARDIAGTGNIASQRKLFSSLSSDMMILLKAHTPKGSMIYVHYCPMAKAYWLSNSKTIRNPYYGKKMNDCGSTTGMIM